MVRDAANEPWLQGGPMDPGSAARHQFSDESAGAARTAAKASGAACANQYPPKGRPAFGALFHAPFRWACSMADYSKNPLMTHDLLITHPENTSGHRAQT